MRTRIERERELESLSVAEIAAEYAKAIGSRRDSPAVMAAVGQMIREILEREFPTGPSPHNALPKSA